jgi:hypothetical protein
MRTKLGRKGSCRRWLEFEGDCAFFE